jgi:cytochrome c-type biogenesis protein CcmH/NrfF
MSRQPAAGSPARESQLRLNLQQKVRSQVREGRGSIESVEKAIDRFGGFVTYGEDLMAPRIMDCGIAVLASAMLISDVLRRGWVPATLSLASGVSVCRIKPSFHEARDERRRPAL